MQKYLCFDIGGLSLKYSVLDFSLTEYENGKIEYLVPPKQEIWDNIRKIYLDLSRKYRDLKIAISTSGIVNSDEKRVYYLNILSRDYDSFSIPEALMLDGVEIKIDNDARCALRAEKEFGNAQEESNVLVYTIGTAFGGSLCIQDKIIIGDNFLAGEIGCGFLDYNDDANISVNTGMLGLMKKYKKLTSINKTGQEIWKLFEKEQDKIAEECIKIQIKNIANVICNSSILLNINTILIGGGISKNELFIKLLTEEVKHNYEKTGLIFNVKIKPCKFHNESGKIGAMTLYK